MCSLRSSTGARSGRPRTSPHRIPATPQVAHPLDLPGRPAIRATLAGDGPIDATFAAIRESVTTIAGGVSTSSISSAPLKPLR